MICRLMISTLKIQFSFFFVFLISRVKNPNQSRFFKRPMDFLVWSFQIWFLLGFKFSLVFHLAETHIKFSTLCLIYFWPYLAMLWLHGILLWLWFWIYEGSRCCSFCFCFFLFKITKTIHTCFFEPWNKFVRPNYPHQKTCMRRYSYFILLKTFIYFEIV